LVNFSLAGVDGFDLKGETVQQDWLVGEPTIGQETEMDR
jgi:hypothetical protein